MGAEPVALRMIALILTTIGFTLSLVLYNYYRTTKFKNAIIGLPLLIFFLIPYYALNFFPLSIAGIEVREISETIAIFFMLFTSFMFAKTFIRG